MTTLTIHLEDEKSEKAIKAVLDALGVKYDETKEPVVFPEHVIAGVRKAKEDLQNGRVKKYQGLNAILNR
jgi:heterodisulfide reductase subunit B